MTILVTDLSRWETHHRNAWEDAGMPIYEYRCERCQNEFESFVWSSRDEEAVECPRCGSKDVKKLMSSFASKASLSSVLGSGCGTGGFS